MKIITLNLWGGIVYEPLVEFIKKHSQDVDVFCFQEVLFGDNSELTPLAKARKNIFSEIASILSEFTPYKYVSPSKHFEYEPINVEAGQAIFVRNTIKVKNQGGIRCYDEMPETTQGGGRLTGSLQWIDLEVDNKIISIASLHGLWQKGTSKSDTIERILQSEKIKDLLSTKDNPKILCGDFNLLPNGKSIEILENGMINLVKKYNIQSTRSNFYKKDGIKFADYILVSPDVAVKDFKVFQDQVSDHLPLFLEF